MGNKYRIDWGHYAHLARKAAAEGAVLLKNDDNVLPLQFGDRVSVFGRIQFDYYKSGTGSGGLVNTKYVVGILDALKEEKGIQINEELEQIYKNWIIENPFDRGNGWAQEPWSQKEMPLDDSTVQRAADISDVAVVIIGRTAGEDRDAQNKKGSYLLTDEEENMLCKVCKAFPRVVVVLNVGNIIDMNWVEKYQPKAVLYTWQGGMEGGHAVVDVLTGRVNPCGKLSDTIAKSIEDYPSTDNFGGKNGNYYTEDIYVGYRYFETFARDKVLYPFGYGLSYTTFTIECMQMSHTDGEVQLSIQVKNTGTCPGKEIVQIYVKPPQGQLGKPVRNLVAFRKTKCLNPEEMEEIVLKIPEYAMASYDDSGVTGHKSAYVLEKGNYEIYIGTDVRRAFCVGVFEESELRVIKQCTEALAPADNFRRLKPQVTTDKEKEREIFDKDWEEVPLRSYSMTERINKNQPDEIVYTGNKGYMLGDVYDGKISIESFVAQLKDEEMCCIVRGEGMCSTRVTPGTAAAFGGVTDTLAEYGIPCGCCADGPSGIRMDCGTYAFSMPNGTCLACTFDEKLVEELYQMEGAELRKNRIDTLLGPGMNIHRNPLNGRNFEYFSEDPILTGKMAAAQLRGMNAYGVTGTIKHFAANNQEYRRNFYNSVVSERALREIYLKGFEIAVKEGKAYSVMTTYGAINGLWTASNYDLTTTILREEWGFDGIVMTDWWAQMNEEGQPASMKNAAAMLRCQNDLYMVTENPEANTTNDNLEESIKNGTLSRGILQRSVISILKMLMRSPIMDRTLNRLSEEELDAYENMEKEDKVDFNMELCPMNEYIELDTVGRDTSRGQSLVYGLKMANSGNYLIRMKVRIKGGELAQIPVSIYTNGSLVNTVTLNGVHGDEAEIKQKIGPFFGTNNFLKFYFAQTGVEIEKISVELTV